MEDIIKLLEEVDFDKKKAIARYDEFRERYSSLSSFRSKVYEIAKDIKGKVMQGDPLADRVFTLIPEDKLRKISELLDNDSISIDDILHTKGQNILLRDKIKTLGKHVDSLLLDRYSAKEMVNDIKESVRDIEVTPVSMNVNINIQKDNGLFNILLLSDLHYGEVINPENISFLNEYNCEIAKQRVMKLFAENLKLAKYTGSSKLVLALMGDLFSGIIHNEGAINNEKTVTKLLIELASFFAGLIREYSKNYVSTEIVCVVGNHSAIRIDHQIQFKDKATQNFEYLLYHMLKDMLPEVKVTIPESPDIIYSIGELKWHISHGDAHKGGNGFSTMPYNTVSRDSLKDFMYYNASGEGFDVKAMGHFHVGGIAYTADGKPMIFNPSIIGGNEYSKERLHSMFPAGQYAIIQDESKIKMTQLIHLQ